MIFKEAGIEGAYIIDLEQYHDDRGFFSRSYCAREFQEIGLNPTVVQCNISFNKHKGTFRGIHSQARPHEEAKLVRCTRGAIHDLILDLRRDSTTFMKHYGVELTAENRRALYVPEGVYHGFLTLEDNCEVFYQMSDFFYPDLALGVRFDDPAFKITLPGKVEVISEKDRGYPDFLLADT